MEEDAWKDAFQNEIIIRNISHFWSLDIEESFQKHPSWLQYTVYSFARFCCQLCGRRWASAKVHILFQIRLMRKTGQVMMHVFKQRCKLCNAAYYEQPEFIPENIEIALTMLVNRICEKFYNIPKENLPSRSFIRDGRQEGPHDSSNCEGCAHGVCHQNSNQGNVQYYRPRVTGTEWDRRYQNNRYTDQYDQDSGSCCNCCVIL
ncbi:receptor-transporting protein 3-like [Dendropsophus ebraccatus]|uniref:receptor-transporting protein 3-like n=1 Tax=Dendropsophus ebraccatus TaxID=150705 RepID=UPI003831BD06